MNELVSVLHKIEQHLSVIASYVELLHVEKTGERVYEVQGYVVGRTSADEPCVHLYSTHPGLEWKVVTVYVERIGELPFRVDESRPWDGDAAPSREVAARKGYLKMAPAPFRVTVVPSGGTTADGKPRHKLGRVIDTAPSPQAQPASAPQPQPAPPPAPRPVAPPPQPITDADADFESLPRASAEASRPKASESLDAAILDEIRLLAASTPYAARRGRADKEAIGLWISLVAETLKRFNCDAAQAEAEAWAITRRIAGVEVPTDGWQPTAGQVEAWLDWISVKHEGRPVRPRLVSRKAADGIARIWAVVREDDKPKF